MHVIEHIFFNHFNPATLEVAGLNNLNAKILLKNILSTPHLSITDKRASSQLNPIKEDCLKQLPHILHKISAKDGTIKFVMQTKDLHSFEAVLVPFANNKYRACLSTQVGCAMGCNFCFTAKMGLKRNLTVSEIIGQYLQLKIVAMKELNLTQHLPIMFMGMGEPTHNAQNLKSVIHYLSHAKLLGMGRRQLTISTVGYIKGMKELIDSPYIQWAWSLHTPFQEQRESIIPTAKTNHLSEIIEIFRNKKYGPNEYLTVEYVCLPQTNMSIKHANELAKILLPLKCVINLIPLNPFPDNGYEDIELESVYHFKRMLMDHGLYALVRTTKGDEIMAACGQLNHQVQEKTLPLS